MKKKRKRIFTSANYLAWDAPVMCLESLGCTRIARFCPLRGKVRFQSKAEVFLRNCSLIRLAIWCPLGGLLRLAEWLATTLRAEVGVMGP